MNSYLDEIVAVQKLGGVRGITSICSANPFVIEASLRQPRDDGAPVLIESTCNQVNQFGGYTGMTPADFVAFVHGIADEVGFPRQRIILGGDHLGPNPWQGESAVRAMDKARVLVRDCVLAGYEKIHLDASMKCVDDDPDQPLDETISAQRAADMAHVAEETFRQMGSGGLAPRYIIGTEVPIPGGVQETEEAISVTPTADVAETIEITRLAFVERGLQAAWERVIAVVVQPGVEFGDTSLFAYDHQAALDLSRFIEGYGHLVYEAHSTDYQTPQALREMVADHFAILKVGPALTFALREAVFALAMMEEEWLGGKRGVELSRMRGVLEEAMLANPAHWRRHYHGDAGEQRFARKYSFSDRSRYYWPVPEVQSALARLIDNLGAFPIPLTLLSQFMPEQYGAVRQGRLANQPQSIIQSNIMSVLNDYAYGCTG